jgi:hypothetical protein
MVGMGRVYKALGWATKLRVNPPLPYSRFVNMGMRDRAPTLTTLINPREKRESVRYY